MTARKQQLTFRTNTDKVSRYFFQQLELAPEDLKQLEADEITEQLLNDIERHIFYRAIRPYGAAFPEPIPLLEIMGEFDLSEEQAHEAYKRIAARHSPAKWGS